MIRKQLRFPCQHLIFSLSCIVFAITNCIFASDGVNTEETQSDGISWHELSVSITAQNAKDERKFLLRPSSGHVRNGHVCGIIGPSGAGKSCFLSALSSTTLKTSNLEISGSVWINERNSITKNIEASSLSLGEGDFALLTQDSSFFTMLTPREVLALASFLQNPSMPHSYREKIVDSTLESLGLAHIQHHRIGERNSGSGISGGEKRRLAVGVELVTTPKIFLADEPTTGLDSCQAEKVVRLMGELVKRRNIPCLCVLHQPRASIWKQLDSFILFASGGKICYMGPREDAIEYFKGIGYSCPQQTNPAEYFIDLVSVDTEDPKQAALDLKRIENIHSAFIRSNKDFFQKSSSNKITAKRPKLGQVRKVRILKRFGALFKRSWRQNIRDSRQNVLRLVAGVGQALLFSQIFKNVEAGPPLASTLSDRIELVSFAVINMSMMSMMKALNLFGNEKPIVTRERTRRQYSGVEYLFSKALAEIPMDCFFSMVFGLLLKFTTGINCPLKALIQTLIMITVSTASLGFAIGSFASNRETALSTGVPILVVLMTVGIINPSGVDPDQIPPAFLRWMKLASPIKWGIEALCISEFKGIKFRKKKGMGRFAGLPKMGALALVRNGNQVLNAIGLAETSYQSVIRGFTILSGVNMGIAVFGLIFSKTTYVTTKDLSDSKNVKDVTESTNGLKSTPLSSESEVNTSQKESRLNPLTVRASSLR